MGGRAASGHNRPVRRFLLLAAVAAALFSAGVAGAAVWDHTHPGDDSQRLWVADWTCRHFGRECDLPKPWHEGWHHREPRYHAAFGGGLAVSAACAALWAAGRRRSRQNQRL
jgi:hypothetical protein